MANPLHYYGDVVRKLFIVGGIVMLALLPFFHDLTPFSTMVSVVAILIIGFVAGAVAPLQTWSIVLNLVVAAIGFLLFEYQAVDAYVKNDVWFALASQALATIFFAAFYFSVKSVRGAVTKHREPSEGDDFALEMLKLRYAKGEITTKEYEEHRKELER